MILQKVWLETQKTLSGLQPLNVHCHQIISQLIGKWGKKFKSIYLKKKKHFRKVKEGHHQNVNTQISCFPFAVYETKYDLTKSAQVVNTLYKKNPYIFSSDSTQNWFLSSAKRLWILYSEKHLTFQNKIKGILQVHKRKIFYRSCKNHKGEAMSTTRNECFPCSVTTHLAHLLFMVGLKL